MRVRHVGELEQSGDTLRMNQSMELVDRGRSREEGNVCRELDWGPQPSEGHRPGGVVSNYGPQFL